jgi:hypothetical protein
VAAGQQLGLRAQLAQQSNRLADGFGRVVFKTRWNHQGLLSYVEKQLLIIEESSFPTVQSGFSQTRHSLVCLLHEMHFIEHETH